MNIDAKIHFHSCLQNHQVYGSNDEFMVSRLFFSVQLPEKTIENLYADIKQTSGDTFESGSIEVQKPVGYKGPFNYNAFRDVAEKYFRSIIGSTGKGIHISNAKNIVMRNNTFNVPMTFDIKIDSDSGAW